MNALVTEQACVLIFSEEIVKTEVSVHFTSAQNAKECRRRSARKGISAETCKSMLQSKYGS